MATYVLVHGAASDSWIWHRVAPKLRARGHDVVAPDLPIEDETAGFTEYADAVVDAIGARSGVVLVAQSMAGMVAPLICHRVRVDLLVLLAAMIPLPGEPPGDWWANTGYEEAAREQAERDGRPVDGGVEPAATFFPDAPPEVVAQALARGERRQSGTPFEQPSALRAWPDVPTRVLLCRDDRFFPVEFMRRVAEERLGITPDEMDGGHVVALSRPLDLVDRLESYRGRNVTFP